MKPRDLILDEYMQLKQKQSVLNKQLKEITDRIKEIEEDCISIGTFVSKKYVCIVESKKQTRLVGLDSVAKVFGFDTLSAHNLINYVEYDTVRITKL